MVIDTYLAGLPVFGMRVLIAEDEVFHAEVLQKMLQVLGFKDIQLAGNGLEALSKAEKEPFHLVITDLEMPGMDGIRLAGALHATKDSAQVPVIMLTCHRDAGLVRQAKEVGINQYIGKPFDILTLREKILQAYADKSPNIFPESFRRAAKKLN